MIFSEIKALGSGKKRRSSSAFLLPFFQVLSGFIFLVAGCR